MPIIKKQKKEVLIPFTVRIEESLLGQLTEYAKYLESSRDYVIAEVIRYIVCRDKEFTERLNHNPHQTAHQDPNQNGAETAGEMRQTAKAKR